MQISNWLEDQFSSVDDALVSANQLYWNLLVQQRGNLWIVQTGEQVLLVSDNRENVDAFLYGMALAYSILPDESLKVVRNQVKTMMGFDPEKDEIFEQLCEFISRELPINSNEIKSETSFEDLGLASLDADEMLIAIQEHFNIIFTDEAAAQMYTINDIVEYILEQRSQQSSKKDK